jgi:hypothetical protein
MRSFFYLSFVPTGVVILAWPYVLIAGALLGGAAHGAKLHMIEGATTMAFIYPLVWCSALAFGWVAVPKLPASKRSVIVAVCVPYLWVSTIWLLVALTGM